MTGGDALALFTFAGIAIMAALAGTDGDAQPPPAKGRAKRAAREAQRFGPRRAHAQALAEHAELVLVWPELAAFLDLFAHRESRWHPNSGASKVGTNGAIGLYQLRPTSAFPPREFDWTPPHKSQPPEVRAKNKADRLRIILQGGPALLDQAINTAAIIRYVASVHGPGRTWLDVAVAGAYPIFARGRPTREQYNALSVTGRIRSRFPTYEQWLQRYDNAVARTHNSAAVVGLPPDFVSRPAYPEGWGGSWRATRRDRGVRSLTVLLGGDASLLP